MRIVSGSPVVKTLPGSPWRSRKVTSLTAAWPLPQRLLAVTGSAAASSAAADPGSGGSYPGAGPDSPVPVHCEEGSRGIEIIDEIAPQPNDLRIIKRRYSCFLGTELELLLRNLDVQTLLVTGVDSNVCVLWTVGEGFQRDYHVRVIEDCVAGTSTEEHEAALLIMRSLTTSRPVLSSEVIDALELEHVSA